VFARQRPREREDVPLVAAIFDCRAPQRRDGIGQMAFAELTLAISEPCGGVATIQVPTSGGDRSREDECADRDQNEQDELNDFPMDETRQPIRA
jgi:hypothetical protein